MIDRRTGPDRRRRPTPAVSRYTLRGRRRRGRRGGELRDRYFDRYAAVEWALIGALLVLVVVDWAWTVAHLARGVEEANPLLAWTLDHGGVVGFTCGKLGVGLAGVAFLLVHARFRWARLLVPLALLFYVGAVGVHVATELAVAPSV